MASYIAEDLRGLAIPIGDLTQDPCNLRLHDERNIESIKGSLRRFGQRKPIVVREGIVRAGNGTLEAARQLGWEYIAVASADDLSPSEATAYAIADNRSAELASWDVNALVKQCQDLGDIPLSDVGFDESDLELLLADLGDLGDGDDDPDPSGGDNPDKAYHKTIALHFFDETRYFTVLDKLKELAKEHELTGQERFGKVVEILCQ